MDPRQSSQFQPIGQRKASWLTLPGPAMTYDARSLLVAQTWDGRPAPRADWVKLELSVSAQHLCIDVDAPLHGDEPPALPVGATPGLWNHEVVEVFVLGDDERYLEVELGPHGHYLVLEFAGPRRVVREHVALDYRVRHEDTRFFGQAHIPLDWLPPGADRMNAYAIHGPSHAREHLAWCGAPGQRPDFHRLETFGALGLGSLSAEVTVRSGRAAARARARA